MDAEHIINAMVDGNFYASNGVFLKKYNRNYPVYTLEVDTSKTLHAITELNLRGKCIEKGKPGFRIDFIGPYSVVMRSIDGVRGTFNMSEVNSYIRA